MGWVLAGIGAVVLGWLLLRRKGVVAPPPPAKVGAESGPMKPPAKIPALTRAPSAPTGLRYTGGRLYWNAPAHRGEGRLSYLVVASQLGDSSWGQPVTRWGGLGGTVVGTSLSVGWYRAGKPTTFAVIASTKYGRAYSKPLRVG